MQYRTRTSNLGKPAQPLTIISQPKPPFLGVVFDWNHDFEGPRFPKAHLDTVNAIGNLSLTGGSKPGERVVYCDVHVWGSPENIYATNTCVVARLVTGHRQRLGRMCQIK